MNDYVVFTDSCADLDDTLLLELDVHFIPMHFTLDDAAYTNWPDGRELSFKAFYEKLRNGASSTSTQVTVEEFKEAFRPVLEKGYDVLYVGLSSGLSNTISSGLLAAEELVKEFPQRTVRIVDSLSASMGEGLLTWHVVQQKKQGKSVNEAADWAENNRLKLAQWVTVDDLHFLKRGGRLSGTAAMVGTMLNIKPMIHVDNDGRLTVVKKMRGRRNSLKELVNKMEQVSVAPQEQTIFISHGDCLADAEFVAEEIRQRMNPKRVYINYIGPVIGGHSGPGTVALFFMANGRD